MNDTESTQIPLTAEGSVAVWCGDQVTAGDGASGTARRYSTLSSTDLGLDEHNYATSGAGWMTGTTLSMQLDIAAGALSGVTVDYVFLMAGLNDSFDNIASMQQSVADAIAKAKKLFPGATVVVGAGPGCIPADMDDSVVEQQAYVLTAIRLAADQADTVTIADMRAICGNDPDLRADGITPNDTGHALLAQTIEQAVREDQGEPVDTPVTDLKRRYVSGLNDMFTRQVRTQRRREAEKREANRPTGTELTQLTSKLDALTRAQGLQQVILQQQQEQLRQQQEMLDRQQQQLKQQQDALASQQDQLKQQQEQLSGVVGQQGSTLASLQSLTARLDTIQNQTLQTIGVNLQTLFNRTDQLLERVQALEDRGSVGA